MTCAWCEEEILPNDRVSPTQVWDMRTQSQRRMHWECGIRSICGSVAHLLRRCGCFVPGSEENDPPGVSTRQAAIYAAHFFVGQQRMRRLIEGRTCN